YLTRSGRLRRKDNTICFEPSGEEKAEDSAAASVVEETLGEGVCEPGALSEIDSLNSGVDGMGDLALEPLENVRELLAGEEAESSEENAPPVRVSERRVIPVEDVDAIWVFREIDLNARVLVFLAQHKVPVHFFNYYGFYAGTFYPREYLHAGYLA